MGYIYILGSERSAAHKIGFSDEPQVRIRSSGRHVPGCKPIAIYYGTMADEMELHKMFNKKRVYGEWFSLGASDLDRIAKHFSDHEQQARALMLLCTQIIQIDVVYPDGTKASKKIESKMRVPEHIKLTHGDLAALKKYNISPQAARAIKCALSDNPAQTSYELAEITGYSVSLIEKTLSSFGKSQINDSAPESSASGELQFENQ